MSPVRMVPPRHILSRERFPIDLSRDLDLEQLAECLPGPNCSIPPGTTIHILPTRGDHELYQFRTGDRPTTAHSVIRYLHSFIRAPLSLQLYSSELSPDVRRAVRRYFLASNGPDGRRLWRAFLDGHRHSRGPTGATLLQNHCHVWRFSQDRLSRWVVDVDVPRLRASSNAVNIY
jgi:hypothetical protein